MDSPECRLILPQNVNVVQCKMARPQVFLVYRRFDQSCLHAEHIVPQ